MFSFRMFGSCEERGPNEAGRRQADLCDLDIVRIPLRPLRPDLLRPKFVRSLRPNSPSSKRGQDKRGFCLSAAIYHNYDIIMA